MEILKFSLKQHTPLLHFQPNEPGATLRASEVKPRLDRFIIEQEGNGEYDQVKNHVKDIHKEWFINKDVYALNYSLRIVTHTGSNITIKEKKTPKVKYNKNTHEEEIYYNLYNFPLVLSNMGGNTDKNRLANFSYTEGPIDLIFIVKDIANGENSNLSAIIKKYIVLFFAQNNFGQRSSKGFGSFTVSEENEKDFFESDPFSFCYIKYNYNVGNRLHNFNLSDFMTLFTVIDFYWKKYLKMKSNYNFRLTGISDIRQKGSSDQRIPSYINFKPIFKDQEVFIYISLNKKVVESVVKNVRKLQKNDMNEHFKEIQDRIINCLDNKEQITVSSKQRKDKIVVNMSINSKII